MSEYIVEPSANAVVNVSDDRMEVVYTPSPVTGPPGTGGVTGPTGPGFVWRGDYNGATAYVVNDVTLHNTEDGGDGNQYIAIANSTGQNPSTATAYWDLYGQRGAIGPDGPAGDDGSTPADGTTWRWRGSFSSPNFGDAAKTYAQWDVVYNKLPHGNGATYIKSSTGSYTTDSDSEACHNDPDNWDKVCARGADGPAGAKGEKGDTGDRGPKGDSITGPRGPKGVKGDDGDPGADAVTGATFVWYPTQAGNRYLAWATSNSYSIIISGADVQQGSATLTYKKNSSTVTLPVTLAPGDKFVVNAASVDGTAGCVVGYKVVKA